MSIFKRSRSVASKDGDNEAHSFPKRFRFSSYTSSSTTTESTYFQHQSNDSNGSTESSSSCSSNFLINENLLDQIEKELTFIFSSKFIKQNYFSFRLIKKLNPFLSLLKRRQSSTKNVPHLDFRLISRVLDGAVKLFARKVDYTRQCSKRLNDSFDSKDEKTNEENEYYDSFSSSSSKRNRKVDRLRNKIKSMHSKIVKKPEKINHKLETDHLSDPFPHQFACDLDLANGSSFFLSNLHVDPLGVMLLDSEASLDFSLTSTPHNTKKVNFDLKKISFHDELSICGTLRNFDFYNRLCYNNITENMTPLHYFLSNIASSEADLISIDSSYVADFLPQNSNYIFESEDTKRCIANVLYQSRLILQRELEHEDHQQPTKPKIRRSFIKNEYFSVSDEKSKELFKELNQSKKNKSKAKANLTKNKCELLPSHLRKPFCKSLSFSFSSIYQGNQIETDKAGNEMKSFHSSGPNSIADSVKSKCNDDNAEIPLNISYAKGSTKINSKLLKKDMWTIIQSQPTDTSVVQLTSSQLSQSLMGSHLSVDKSLSFDKFHQQLDSHLAFRGEKPISVPITFVTLLHLCNDRSLVLDPNNHRMKNSQIACSNFDIYSLVDANST